MNKQTALQWLIGYYYDNEGAIGIKQLEQAAQMEKEQIMKAHISGGARLEDISIEAAEQYYEQTYGGQDEN
jgi:hypothetical protein